MKIKGLDIQVTTSVKYLGVTIDNKLNWNEHITNTINKSKKSLFAVNRAIGKKTETTKCYGPTKQL